MAKLTLCSPCGGFVPRLASRCPHCGAHLPRSAARKLLNAAGGGAVALTLMACYGGGPRPYGIDPHGPLVTNGCSEPSDDLDKDGYCSPADCDEVNAAIHPGAQDDPGDGIDRNCDGVDGMAGSEPAPAATPAPTQTIAE